MGFFNSGQRLGSLIAVTAGAVLFQLTSREVTFVALAGVGLVGMIIATRVPDLRLERIRASGGGLLNSLNPWDVAVSRLPEYGRKLRAPLLSISLMRFATAFASNGLAIATVAPYLAEFADENEKVLGGSLAVVTLAGLLVGFRWFSDLGLGVPLGHLSDRVGRRISIAYGMAVMFASLALIAAFDSVIGAIVGILLLFIASVGVNTSLDAGHRRNIARLDTRCRDGQVLNLAGSRGRAGSVHRISDCRQNRFPGSVSRCGRASGRCLGAIRHCHR